MPAPSLVAQTTYAELLERCLSSAFGQAFEGEGTFSPKTIKGRRYWYFQQPTTAGRRQRYVGPETPELLERISHHRQRQDDERERRTLVSALTRSFGLPAPVPSIGEVVTTLAQAGIFRLRAVLVGTVAYQTYPAMLAAKLPNALLQTSDVDIAQFTEISMAIGDRTAPMLEILRGVDNTFREVPSLARGEPATSFIAKGGLRVDFVTPNTGPNTDRPRNLTALQTSAHPLRYLDFLIRDPIHAVMLHKAGVLVSVPAPERFAIHKLILALERSELVSKRDKDIAQAQSLILTLLEKRAYEIQLVWDEAFARGPKWRKLLLGGVKNMSPGARDLLLRAMKLHRNTLAEIELTFIDELPQYDSSHDVVRFPAEALGALVRCAVSGEALEDYFGSEGRNRNERLAAFQRHRSKIEAMVRKKYLSRPIEEPESVLLSTPDIQGFSGRRSESRS